MDAELGNRCPGTNARLPDTLTGSLSFDHIYTGLRVMSPKWVRQLQLPDEAIPKGLAGVAN